MDKQLVIIMLKAFWKMKWWMFPLTLLICLWGLCEAIENKWERRSKHD